jgi:signal transduction histidine kinase
MRARRVKVERDRADAERSSEDEVLQKEYARADKVTARERADRARLAAELLAHERKATDRSLLLERTHADALLSRRDEFLGMVSHDLRNELSAITLNVALILKQAAHDEGAGEIFRSATNIHRTNARMSRLIGDLLDVASIDVGRFTVVTEDQEVRRAVDDIFESFAPIASAKGVSLTIDSVDDSLSAHFDGHRIQQVLGNLLTNALKFTPEGGSVALRVERKHDLVWFTVADDGSGIAPDRLQAIFDRFSQGERPDRNGLGLGLFIARHIVEAHGGRIWAESVLGRGSAFHFTLPLRATRRRPHRANGRAPRSELRPGNGRPSPG